jgi:hypothetical protein
MTPTEVLDSYPALTLTQAAYCMGLVIVRGERKGEPDRRKIINLINDGKLSVIDKTRPNALWTVSAVAVRKYIAQR